MTPKLSFALYAIALAAAIAFVYSFSLNNQLVFDDERLTDGTVFGQYGSLMQLKARTLSYGSFVWVKQILGDGWWKQRVFNIALHIGTALILYALVLDLLGRTQWNLNDRQKADASRFASSLRNAARAGVALWAFNPVAVYAVAYLIQRSILMATLFVALACLGFVRGLTSGRWYWHLVALVSYALAAASKEHAISAIFLTVPLFVFVKRPPLKRIAQVAGATAVVLGAAFAGALLFTQYGSIVGSVFDEISRAHAIHLEKQWPGISQKLYPLSIINQASLFFHYGLLWLVPYVGWMSIDMRPAFPVAFISAQLVGAVGWLGLLLGSAWLVLRRTDAWALAGLALLMPALLFVTEFLTVWLQDPLVLYRSYLWSIGIPILLALPLVGRSDRKLYALVLIAVGVLAAGTFERIQSLSSPTSTWVDASAKIDLQAPVNAVGRWRPVLNQGEAAMFRGNFDEALRLFTQAEALGENLGESARLRIQVAQRQQLANHAKILDQLAVVQAKGLDQAALLFERGESEYGLARYADAFESFSKALTHRQAPQAEEMTRLRQAEAAIAIQKYDDAIASYRLLIKQSPDNQRYQVGLSVALVGKQDYQAALSILNPAIAKDPTGPAHYARALAHFYMGDRSASKQDIDIALRAEPGNPVYRQLLNTLNDPTAQSTAIPANKP